MQVFFVNGNPRAGKDTFVDMVRDELRPWAFSTSWIDPVKDALGDMGVDVSAKTEADRLLLAEFGDSLERHSQFMSRRCVHFALTRGGRDRVIFIYARQQGPMRTMEQLFRDVDPAIVTRRILVTRPEAAELRSNKADAGVNHIAYDIVIGNDASLDDLQLMALHFAGLCRNKGLRDSIRRTPLALRASSFTPIGMEKAA